MTLINNLIAKQGEEVALQGVSHPAIAVAVGRIYQAALAMRNASGVTVNDITQYLNPAATELVRQLHEAASRARLPRLEQAPVEPTPDLVRNYEDKAADFLAEVNHNGGGVQLR